MIVTEEEAKNKLCPFAVAESTNYQKTCAGSECMAWQNFGGVNQEDKSLFFCGIAGKPNP